MVIKNIMYSTNSLKSLSIYYFLVQDRAAIIIFFFETKTLTGTLKYRVMSINFIFDLKFKVPLDLKDILIYFVRDVLLTSISLKMWCLKNENCLS